ncbi:DUF1007 family protein [Pokkaliibacter sp. CJK22405]|uniref:DUF1007 family protein n=1 Tax=Pokkaliibacter sp. CJK22405 TaxID=3384615 RepID=UPI00398546F3
MLSFFRPRLIGGLLFLATGPLAALNCWAHPHVFMDYSLNFTVEGTVLKAIDVDMVLDPMTTTNLLNQYDTNGNGNFEGEELTTIRQLLDDSMKEFDYFFFLLEHDDLQKLAKVEMSNLHLENGVLGYHLHYLPARPINMPRNVELGFVDMENYFDMQPVDPNPVTFTGKTTCTYRVIDPIEAEKRDLVAAKWFTFNCGKS